MCQNLDYTFPRIDIAADDSYQVTWSDSGDIYVQRFATDGTAVGNNLITSSRQTPVVASQQQWILHTGLPRRFGSLCPIILHRSCIGRDQGRRRPERWRKRLADLGRRLPNPTRRTRYQYPHFGRQNSG